jgi:hypothetical protein
LGGFAPAVDGELSELSEARVGWTMNRAMLGIEWQELHRGPRGRVAIRSRHPQQHLRALWPADALHGSLEAENGHGDAIDGEHVVSGAEPAGAAPPPAITCSMTNHSASGRSAALIPTSSMPGSSPSAVRE